jgi:hypothetical protein|eukprot:COSAG02_NODE_3698_length_6371_cov_14.095823_3_plen_191_part_00
MSRDWSTRHGLVVRQVAAYIASQPVLLDWCRLRLRLRLRHQIWSPLRLRLCVRWLAPPTPTVFTAKQTTFRTRNVLARTGRLAPLVSGTHVVEPCLRESNIMNLDRLGQKKRAPVARLTEAAPGQRAPVHYAAHTGGSQLLIDVWLLRRIRAMATASSDWYISMRVSRECSDASLIFLKLWAFLLWFKTV